MEDSNTYSNKEQQIGLEILFKKLAQESSLCLDLIHLIF